MRFELPKDRPWLHECSVPVRWGDMDAFQHVNNTAYLRYMEIARIDWLAEHGVHVSGLAQGPVVVNVFCSFFKPLVFPATLKVRQCVGEVGRSSFEIFVSMVRDDAPEVEVAAGGSTVVWVDYASGASVVLPPPVRAALSSPLSPPPVSG